MPDIARRQSRAARDRDTCDLRVGDANEESATPTFAIEVSGDTGGMRIERNNPAAENIECLSRHGMQFAALICVSKVLNTG